MEFKEHKVYFGIGMPNENEKYPSLSKWTTLESLYLE